MQGLQISHRMPTSGENQCLGGHESTDSRTQTGEVRRVDRGDGSQVTNENKKIRFKWGQGASRPTWIGRDGEIGWNRFRCHKRASIAEKEGSPGTGGEKGA